MYPARQGTIAFLGALSCFASVSTKVLMNEQAIENWQPKPIAIQDFLTASPLRRFAALLDLDVLPGPSDQLPPLGHWLFFLPEDKQSTLSSDGHPRTGGFLPPISVSRRMWAGGSLEFLRPVPLEVHAVKTSVVESIDTKNGNAGALTFVTVNHSLEIGGEIYVRERQNLVYLSDVPSPRQVEPSVRPSSATQRVVLDITALFRFSALTFNAHRIHYDGAYARQIEGYTGLLVHGPFQAMLLMNHVQQSFPHAKIGSFSFRAGRPLVVDGAFELRLAETETGIDLWTVDESGVECMTANAVFA
jgi:3-methylfumaryl-CoA hydratase